LHGNINNYQTKARAGAGGRKTLYGQLFGYLYFVGRSVMKKKLFIFLVLFVFLPLVSLVTGLLMYDLSFASGAEGELVIKGSEQYGLRVEYSDNPFMFENLYPGYPFCPGEGEESSTIVKISNTGEKIFKLLIEKKVLPDDVEELELYNYEGLKVDIFERGGVDKKMFSGPLKELQKIEAGTVTPGARAREFEFSISLDEGAGNELQGKSIDLQWIFTATGTIDEPDPLDLAMGGGTIDFSLPKTGEFPPFLLYAAGAFLIAAGFVWKERVKSNGKNKTG
jgi:LPXTG-motif cell wall-anchored protein